MTKPPNILFLMSDEHRPDVAGYAGNSIVRTPTLDWLAETGVVFNNAYTPSPICTPARQAMTAGQLPRTCGVEHFGEDLPPFSMTFARRFAQHAYTTTCCGKLHHEGADQMQGWTHRPAGDLEVRSRYIDGCDPAALARFPRPANQKWSDAKEACRAGIGSNATYQLFDELATTAAKMAIRKHFLDPYYDRPGHTPLLLKLSLIQPHYPYFTSDQKFTYYLNRVQPFLNEPVFDHPFLSQRQVTVGTDGVTERDLRRATAAYYGMIETIDDHYGSVLDALRHVGQDLDDWIIIYTSDHGEMLGEHGIWEKQKFFEASARVPLIIRWPRRLEHRVVNENVNLCDLFATLCDLADIPLPPPEQTVGGRGLDSRSLVALMRGHAREWRERYHDETISQFAGRNLMIKRGALKYQWYGADMPEVLFDLSDDPSERRNLAHEPRYTEAMEMFRRRRDELGFGDGQRDAYVNAGY